MYFKLSSYEIIWIFYGVLANLVLSYLVHLLAFKLLNYRLQTKENEYDFKMLICLVSPDFYFSKIFKNKLPKLIKKDYIKKLNKLNLIVSSILLILLLIHEKNFLITEESFFICRVISRIFEITYAFYKDITEAKPKTSTLISKERLKLSINSYFEIIVLYACIYYIFFENTFCSAILFSFFVSTFSAGISICNNKFIECKYLYITVATQILATINIITLSIANYIGDCKDK